MTLRCADCDWELPVDFTPVTVDTDTGDVTTQDMEAVIEESDNEIPPCPKCDGDVSFVSNDGDE